MKAWLEDKMSRGYEYDSHPKKSREAILSVHHSRLLLNLFFRELLMKQQALQAQQKASGPVQAPKKEDRPVAAAGVPPGWPFVQQRNPA